MNHGNFEAVTKLTEEGKTELQWWIDNVEHSHYPLEVTEPQIEFKTDASTSGGWGAVCQSVKTGGRWNEQEKTCHINVLELLAVDYALKSFSKQVTGKHVKLLTDNSCAVAYLNNMGGSRSVECDRLAKRIWIWCKERQIWLTVAHIAGILNVAADRKSRSFNDSTEWMLNTKIFESISDKFGKPEIDLFGSRLNYQVKPFVSWHPDPESFAVDAFTINWKKWFIYAFPPFSVIQRVLAKIERDQTTGVVVLPLWTTAVWYPQFLRLLIDHPVLLPRGKNVLSLEHASTPHPLHKKLQLIAATLSGMPSKHVEFQKKLVQSYVHHGVQQPRNSMNPTYAGGKFSVLNGIVIRFMRL